MPERKSGPVKPPVIEASANTGAAQAKVPPKSDDAAAGAASPKAATSARPEPKRQPSPHWTTVGAVIAGALLGTALTGSLVTFGVLQPPAGNDSRLTALQQKLDAEADRSAGLKEKMAELADAVGNKAAASDVAALQQQLAAVPTGETADTVRLDDEITALSQRIDQLSTATTTGGSDNSAEIETLTQRLDAINSALDQQKQETDAALMDLRKNLDAARASAGDAAQLPLLLVSLGDAFAAGTPYDAPLAGIEKLVPGFVVPEVLKAKAGEGLAPEAQLAREFNTALPAMLAAAPASPDAGWQGTAMDWLKGQLALRPATDPGGDSPEAQIARLEAAMADRNYGEAATLFAALPQPMRAAAGSVPEAVAAHAEAASLINNLRQQALAPQAGGTP
jgi:hypothetical protein